MPGTTAITPLLAVLPDLGLIALGALFGRLLTPEAWKALDRLNFQVLFPALLFVAASSRPVDPADLLSIGLAVWLIIGVACAAGYVLRRYGPKQWTDFAGAWQTSWRFNTAMAFVVVQAFPPAVAGFLAIAVGMAVPFANVLAVSALTRGKGSVLSRAREVALNPFLLASLAGVAVALTGTKLPALPNAVVGRLADAALPLTLLSIGAALDWSKAICFDRFYAGLHLVKLVLLPGLVMLAMLWLDASPPICAALILFAALPTASASHVLAARYGADRSLVATIVTQSSLIGCLTLPAWCLVLLLWF